MRGKHILTVLILFFSFGILLEQPIAAESRKEAFYNRRFAKLTDEQRKHYFINIDSILVTFNQYVRISDSLFTEVEKLAYLNVDSPFFTMNEEGNLTLRDRCSTYSVSLPHHQYLYIFYLLTLSFTHCSDGMGPTVHISDESLPDNEGINLNYAQFLATVTWYKINRERVEEDSFAYFCASPYGDNWGNILKDRISIDMYLNFDPTNFEDEYEIIEDHVSDIMNKNMIKLADEVRSQTVDVSTLFNISQDYEGRRKAYTFLYRVLTSMEIQCYSGSILKI